MLGGSISTICVSPRALGREAGTTSPSIANSVPIIILRVMAGGSMVAAWVGGGCRIAAWAARAAWLVAGVAAWAAPSAAAGAAAWVAAGGGSFGGSLRGSVVGSARGVIGGVAHAGEQDLAEAFKVHPVLQVSFWYHNFGSNNALLHDGAKDLEQASKCQYQVAGAQLV